jgi:hypothetical protein
MGIQSFTPVSGGSPDRQFIATTSLTTTARDWPVVGAAGNYLIMSATNQAGYVIYTDGTNKTGAPVGKAVYVAHSFSNITIMGLEADQFTLYKVSPKSTTAVSDVFSRFTIGHTTITSSGNHSFPGTYLPVVDLLAIGAGGGAGHHGGAGGGGGAYIYFSKFPMNAVTPVTIPGRSGYTSKGGSTIFGGIVAEGGGGGAEHGGNQPTTGANGGGASGGHWGSSQAGATGNIPTNLPYGFTYAGPYAGQFTGGHSGGSSQDNNSWSRRGGGGGGATGAGSTGHNNGGGNGGAGVISPFTAGSLAGLYFSAGGRGSQHSPGQVGSNGAHWSDGGYGMGGAAHHDSQLSSAQGGPGVIGYRSYS